MGLRLLPDPPSWEGHLELRSGRPGFSDRARLEDGQTALEIRRTRRSENAPQRKLGLVDYALSFARSLRRNRRGVHGIGQRTHDWFQAGRNRRRDRFQPAVAGETAPTNWLGCG